MLIGCCHCEDDPSESLSSSESESVSSSGSDSVSSAEPLSTRELECGDCDAVPYRWRVTLAGWTAAGAYPSHSTCCNIRNDSFILSYHAGVFGYLIGVDSYTAFCRIWTSSEFAKNQNASPPTCVDSAPPLIAMGLRSSGLSATVIDLSVYTFFGGLGGTGRHSFTRQASGQCFYNGFLDYSGGGSTPSPRCVHGTVLVEPAT